MHPSGDEDGRQAHDLALRAVRELLHTHPACYHLRDDLISEAMEYAVRARDSFDPTRSSYEHWVLLRVRWGVRAFLRDHGSISRTDYRHGWTVDTAPDHLRRDTLNLEGLIPTQRGPSDYERVDDRLQAEWLLSRLPPREERLVREHYWQDRPLTDMAEAEGVTLSAISQCHRQALRRLRKAL